MCGIAGFADRTGKVSAEALNAASRALAHRGPDDAGLQVLRMGDGSGCVGLANRRLAILDLSPAGHQPMFDSDTGNWITFNGEVYNFRDLRCELEAQGAHFTSHTDTEVVLKAYGFWGERCLDRFRGMFAIAIWDAARQRLFLARDRLGKKPLYYCESDGLLLFASEVRALLATGLTGKRMNPAALEQFLEFGSVSDPETLIEGVQALPAGCCLTWQDGRTEVREYWDLASSAGADKTLQESAVILKLRALLDEALELRMVSDVPVGVFLSGGIDSSALVAELSGTCKDINTFSIIFKDADAGYSEAESSRMIAHRFHTEHRELELSGADFLESIPEAIAAMDQPSVDGFNTFTISREVRRAGLKVALSGLGADELFAGYGTFASVPRMEKFLGLRRWIPHPLRAAISAAILESSGSDQRRKVSALVAGNGSTSHPYFLARSLFVPDQRRKLISAQLQAWVPGYGASVLPTRARNLDPVNRVSYLELRHYMANTLLRDTDCMSMANGLEVRAPFLDHRLVEYALSIPGELKMRTHTPKHLLVKAMQGLLPGEIVHRPKRGFTLPFERWLHGQLKSSVETVLAGLGDGPLGNVLAPAEVLQVWQKFLEGKTSWSRPWALYVLDRWCRNHL
ncbi:MAG: asparagine synthase (glutamine-hydrolyzing) [Acidobacteriia bacterium]|nr:asparagine synthase (glutamine-hydrolyzing) [Terriglobia bacterium]